MGVGNISDFNLAMLTKWWWRFKENPDQMWAKVVAAIHQNRNTAQLVPFKTSVPGVWKDIGSMDSKLSKLGIDLTQCLTQNNGSWSWRNDEEQLFSVKQVRKDLEIARLAGIPDDPCFSWNTWATPKANFLLWRVLIDRIASRENLIKRGVQLDDEFCPRCGLSLESRDHIFLSCIWARCIWWNVLAWVRIKYPVEVYSFREFLDYVNQCPGSKVWKHIIQLIILATVWRIWNARNEKVFEGRFIPINTSVDLIKEDSFVWLSNRANARRPLWDSWKMFDVVNLL
ncbi:putative reverse transcriptase zinc-binding domain-containing protein [Helianthus annuus]|uniref:Reverse transcriptase zinc-binding domain-containing protein n=1 Tax=Helianthus annuus TaxID=4232 RepID=A0A9K3JD32_HELAN|nr:putative reverse transcriptase zinc-binding domain-containing protein [Helianthus annuus]KAJ0661840.1 putative reverse transcriptase zinc-binding domain-containing protein [Helianthus annuus]